MGLSREQVEQHIAGVQKRLGSETERKQHGYVFAKLCFQVKSYEDAFRYLSEYLTVQEKDAKAHKLMGRLCEAMEDVEKATVHYKRSLELKKGQRDVIFAVAELYCRLDEPPVEAVKHSLQQIRSISETHPLILPLSEKLQALQGTLETSTVEDLITKQLAVSSQDADLHIRLVKLYSRSGKLPEAFQYCQVLNERRQFTDCIPWQSCALETAEKFYEFLRNSGSDDSEQLVEVLVAVLEAIRSLFGLLSGSQLSTLPQCASLLLKFDQVLFATALKLQPSSNRRMGVYRMILRELGGQFYLMIAEYFYLCGHRMNKYSVMGKSNQLFQLGDFCLLTSLKAMPPDLQGAQLQKWHTAACGRLSRIGRHMMVITARKGDSHFNELPKYIESQGDKLYLIRTLFGENQDLASIAVVFGSQEITYSLQQSFLAADKPLSEVPLMPSHEDLCICDQVHLAENPRDLRGLIWLSLVFKALKMQPLVAEWLSQLFDNLQLDTHNLKQHEADSLCLFDLEAFLVLVTQQCEANLTLPSHKLYSVPATPPLQLNSVLVQYLPCCLSLEAGTSMIGWWRSAISLLYENISVQEGVVLKKEVQAGLGWLRGCSPLQLNLTQLVTLARHFKERAESIVELEGSHSLNYRDVVLALLRRSSHYWETIISAGEETSKAEHRKYRKQRNITSSFATSGPTIEDVDIAGLVEESQMALANIALYKKDTTRALRLYSRVKTPHAAWNQSQIYRMLAEEGGMLTPKDAHTRISNLEKALEALSMAIVRLSPSDDTSLKEKLLKQKEEVQQLLGDAKMSPVVRALQYESPEKSPSLPRNSSTPNTTSPSSAKGTPVALSTSLRESLRKKDEQLAAMSQHLQQLQAEMDELKKSHGASFLSTPTTQSRNTSKQLTPPPVAQLQISGGKPLQHFHPTTTQQEQSPAVQPVLQQYHTSSSPQTQQATSLGMLGPHQAVQSTVSSAVNVAPSMPQAMPLLLPSNTRMESPHVFQQQESLDFIPSQTTPFKPPDTQPSYINQYELTGDQLHEMSMFQSPATSQLEFSTGTPPSASTLFNSQQDKPQGNHLAAPLQYYDAPTGAAQSRTALFPNLGSMRLTPPSAPRFTPMPPAPSDLGSVRFLPPSAPSDLGTGMFAPMAAPSNLGSVTFTSMPPAPFTYPQLVPSVTSTTTTTPGFSVAGLPQFAALGEVTKPQPGLSTSTLPFQFQPSSSGVGGPTISSTTTADVSSTVPTSFPLLSSLLSTSAPLTSQPSLQTFTPFSGKPLTSEASSFSFKLQGVSGKVAFDEPFTSKPFLTGEASLSSLGKSLFTSTASDTKQAAAKLTEGSASEGEDEEDQHEKSLDGVYIAPIVSLPELAEIKSGEEQEEVLFCHRAKLFRFDSDMKQWKDRGIGDMKILQHRESGRVRLLMRREQVLKLCCNHCLTPEMTLTTLRENQLAWFTPCDFADGVAKPEKLAVKFKQPSTAQKFIEVFERCVADLDQLDQASEGEENGDEQEENETVTSSIVTADTSKSLLSEFAPPPGSWSCEVCLVHNSSSSLKCAACGTSKPVHARETSTSPLIFPSANADENDSLLSKFTPVTGSWDCEVCLLANSPSAVKCVACGGNKPGQLATLQSSNSTSSVSTITATSFPVPQTTGGFQSLGGSLSQPLSIFSKFTLPGSWTCTVCFIQNQPGVEKCVACNERKREEKPNTTSSANPFLQASTATQPPSFQTLQLNPPVTSDSSQPQSLGGVKIEALKTTSLRSMAAQSQPPKVQETGGGMKIEGLKLTSIHPSDSPFQFGTLKLPTIVAESGKDEVAEDEHNVSLEREPDVYFKPVVTLPMSRDIKTGEEEEEVVFSHRAKLYRFDPKDKQWKDRGIGDMKILKHKTGKKVRLLMRRDQILKICCNHYLTANMSLTPHNNSDKAWTWYTPSDFADEVQTPETFVLRFKLPEVARQFKAAFDECVFSLSVTQQPNSQASGEGSPSSSRITKTPASEHSPLANSWSCGACLVQNKQQDDECVACGTSRPDATSEPPAIADEVHEVTAPSTTSLDNGPTTHIPSASFATKDVEVETEADTVVDDDVKITAVDMPPQEKVDLAKKYMLPLTFYNYENKPPCPGCRGCDNETEGEFSSSNSTKPTGEEKEQSSSASTETDVKTSTDLKDVPEDSTKWKPFAGLFSFGSSSPSFADIATSGSTGPSIFGAPATKSEGFFRAGEVLFSSRADPQDDENYNPESETDTHFKPLVSLPEVAVRTGEEDEEAIFTHRTKLYRFDSNIKQWKERGVGDIKILRNKATSKTRILMRRDQILKLCCNHLITADMNVVPTAGSDKSLTWHTPCDYADEVAKPEKFSVKFKLPETAQEFKKIFDRCTAALHSTDTEQDEQKSTEHRDSSEEKGRSSVVTGETLKQKLAPPPGTWSCEVCLVSNPPSENKCAACGVVNPACQKANEHDLEAEQPPLDTECSQLRFPLEFSSPPPPNLNKPSIAVNSATSPLCFPLSLGPHVSPSTPASEPSSPNKVEEGEEEEEEGGKDGERGDEKGREQEDKEKDGERGDEKGGEQEDKERDGERGDEKGGEQEDKERDGERGDEKGGEQEDKERDGERGDEKGGEQEDKEKDGERGDEKGREQEDKEKDGEREDVKDGEQEDKEKDGERGDENSREQEDKEEREDVKGGEQDEEKENFIEQEKGEDAERGEKEEWEEERLEKEEGNQGQEKGREVKQEEEQGGKCREGKEEEDGGKGGKEEWEEERVDKQDREEKQERDSKEKQEEYCKEHKRPIGSPSAVLQVTGEGEKVQITYKETEKPVSPSQPTRDVPMQPPTSNTNDDGDVVFLHEELPDQALIEKAEMFMLPRSFYLYEKKPPCPGCRGCRDESDSKDVVRTATPTECIDEATGTSQELADHQESTTFSGLHFQPSGMLSFSDLASNSSTGFAECGQKSGDFVFQGAGQQLFSSKVEEEDTNPEAEADIQFRPIVSLPETYTVASWDDDADTLFSHRAKLYRFDANSKQWNERGVGDMKILKHRETEKVRMIMRRDQILKICCNHHITADMSLKPGGSEMLWIWFTPSDYSDETPKPEQLQIRFKHAKTAMEFKKVFDECVRDLQWKMLEDVETKPHASYQAPQELDESLASKFKLSAGSWTCNVCLVSNTAQVTRCAACRSAKEGFDQHSTMRHAEDESVDSVPKAPSPLDTQQSSTPSVTFGSAGGIKLDILQSTPLQATSGEYKPISLSGQPNFGTKDST